MPGDLNQSLYLAGLPKGLKFEVVSVVPSIEEWQRTERPWFGNNWAAAFYFRNGDFCRVDRDMKSEYHGSHEVPRVDEGVSPIGSTKFSPVNGVHTMGSVGDVAIRFTVKGTVEHEGEKLPIDKAGFITVSATDWAGFARPDYSIISYYWDGSAAKSAKVEVPPTIGTPPADVHIIIGLDPSTKQLGISFTTHKDFAAQAIDWAIVGVFKLNEKMKDWALSEFGL